MEQNHSVQEGPGPVQPGESSSHSAQSGLLSADPEPFTPDSAEVHSTESLPNEPQPNESEPGSPQQGPSQSATPDPDQPALAQSNTVAPKRRPPKNPNATTVQEIDYKDRPDNERSIQIVRPQILLSFVGEEKDRLPTWPECQTGSGGKKEVRMKLVPQFPGKLWESICPVMFRSSFGALVPFSGLESHLYITFLESENKPRYGPRWMRRHSNPDLTMGQQIQPQAHQGFTLMLPPPNPDLPSQVYQVERRLIDSPHHIDVPQNQQFQHQQFLHQQFLHQPFHSAWRPVTQPHPQQPPHNQMLPFQPSVEQSLPNQASFGQGPHNQVLPNLHPWTQPLSQQPLPQPLAPQQLAPQQLAPPKLAPPQQFSPGQPDVALVQGQAADLSDPAQFRDPTWDFTNDMQDVQLDPNSFEMTDDNILALQQQV